MDSKQNELFKSYLRTRKLADNNTEFNNQYKQYEVDFFRKGLSVDEILKKGFFVDDKDRANVYNNKFNTDFYELSKFLYNNNSIALAKKKSALNIPLFVDKNLNKTLNLTNKDILINLSNEHRAYYFNIIMHKQVYINEFTFITDFTYADGNHAIAYYTDNKYFSGDFKPQFIGIDGYPSIEHFTPDDIDNLSDDDLEIFYSHEDAENYI